MSATRYVLLCFVALGCGAFETSPEHAPVRVAEEGEAEEQVGGAEVSEVACGDLTCGPTQYCLIECTCCGTRIPEPDEASARYSCVELPAECSASALCGCGSAHAGLCNAERRTVETPCA